MSDLAAPRSSSWRSPRTGARTWALALACAAAPLVACLGAGRALAEENPIASVPDVENAKNSFPGIVNANAVYVRCGPADSYYATLKLEKGTKVTVVGIKMDWLKIVPPDGSFCYVAKAYVEKYGDGTKGRTTKDSVNVRAGSALNTLKVVPLCQLTQGVDVEIIGEQEEYFKIKPPEKAYVYVNKQFVDPDPSGRPQHQTDAEKFANNNGGGGNTRPPVDVRPPQRVTPEPPPQQPVRPQAPENGTDVVQAPPAVPVPPVAPDGAGPREVAIGDPATRPATVPSAAGDPATRPAQTAEDLEKSFDQAELQFGAASRLPLEKQPIAELIKSYEPLAANDALAPTLRSVAAGRLAALRNRATAAAELVKIRAAEDEARQRQMALDAERKELQERLAASTVQSYTAVGTLQASSLQLGTPTLYRLTDPANGRTVCYVRSSDGKVAGFLGKFVGIKGELTTESSLSLKVITPTDVAAVEQGKVNRGVTAQLVPPSMLPSTADVSNESH